MAELVGLPVLGWDGDHDPGELVDVLGAKQRRHGILVPVFMGAFLAGGRPGCHRLAKPLSPLAAPARPPAARRVAAQHRHQFPLAHPFYELALQYFR